TPAPAPARVPYTTLFRSRGARRRIRPAALGAHARRPILPVQPAGAAVPTIRRGTAPAGGDVAVREPGHGLLGAAAAAGRARRDRSEEHTSELQSDLDLVC